MGRSLMVYSMRLSITRSKADIRTMLRISAVTAAATGWAAKRSENGAVANW